ncbi:MAG: flavin reductase [Chloroflexi bacterium]|nr:flavin reductase [Chloroflexota bacterium]
MNPKALFKLSYGIYVVCSKDGDKMNGQIANTVIQVASEPAIIAVAINKKNLTHEYISKSGVFTASILAQDTPLSFIGNFGFKSGREINKFEGINYKTGETGTPIVTDNTLAYLEVKVTGQLDAVTHTVFIGEVVGAEVIKEGEPMTYAYYHEIKRGSTPKTAPSYVEVKKEAKLILSKYECTVCGYIYDPEKGDPDGKIPPGTPFEKLPDSWTCPVCGAAKSEFKKVV